MNILSLCRALSVKVVHVGVVLVLLSTIASELRGQQNPSPSLSPTEATKLAQLMCSQLPNLASVQDAVITIDSHDRKPTVEPFVWDDVYDALINLGKYSVPCLVNSLSDTRWMPDPRMEPLLGAPVIGDVAYMVLTEKGVPDLLPSLAKKNPKDMGMDDYFLWPSRGDNRLRLQAAVRKWTVEHPNCCAAPPTVRNSFSKPLFRMSLREVDAARQSFARLRPSMSNLDVRRIVGEPVAVEREDANGDTGSDGNALHLLGVCSGGHNERSAYIYFVERWTKDIGRRDPLRDRYVIVYFNADGRFTRMFSNVTQISPIFPKGERSWQRVMWGRPAAAKR